SVGVYVIAIQNDELVMFWHDEVLMAPKLKTTHSGSQRRTKRVDNPHQLWDEATDFENEDQEVGVEGATLSYLTRSTIQQQATVPQYMIRETSLQQINLVGMASILTHMRKMEGLTASSKENLKRSIAEE
ncbi:hypothetical protein HAX54_031690, partial [Datura stramonium]|nr:hypothetical protein [Datura stramonium]